MVMMVFSAGLVATGGIAFMAKTFSSLPSLLMKSMLDFISSLPLLWSTEKDLLDRCAATTLYFLQVKEKRLLPYTVKVLPFHKQAGGKSPGVTTCSTHNCAGYSLFTRMVSYAFLFVKENIASS